MQHLLVHDVETDVWTGADQQGIGFAEIGGDHVRVSVDATQGHRQLHPDLSGRTDDQYLFFCHAAKL